MSKWERRHTIFSLFTILFFIGIVFISFSYPKFERVKSFKIVGINEDGTFNASASIEISCGNWFSFSGRDIEFSMFYGDSLVSKGSSREEEIVFKKNSSFELPIFCNFNPNALGDDLERFLFRDSIEFKAEITGKFTLFNLKSKREIELKIPMSELVESIVSSSVSKNSIKIDSMRVEEISIMKTKIENHFQVENLMSVEYCIGEIDFKVFSDEEYKNEISEGLYEVNSYVQPGESVMAKGFVEINNIKSFRSGISKIMSKELVYYMVGEASIQIGMYDMQIPIEEKFTVNPLNKSIKIIE